MLRIRKFIASALAFAMLAGTVGATAVIPCSDTPFGITVSAADIVKSDKCGDNVFYTLDSEGTLTISGTGAMDDYVWDWHDSPFYCNYGNNHCNEEIKKVIIEDGVTSIGSAAFESCTSLSGITIPDSVTSIGGYAFYYCTSLTSITIPDGVTSIGNHAFEDCYHLTSVTIPDSVTSIGEFAFYRCESLTSITIPDSVTSIENKAFGYYYDYGSYQHEKLPGFTIKGYNGTKAERYANENGFEFISLDETKITESGKCGDNVFYTLDSEGTLTISGTGAMYDYEYDGSPFHNNSDIKKVIVKEDVTSIGDSAFVYCTSLTDITIPDSVTIIEDMAFYNCSSLKDITIPDSVTSIGSSAFSSCYSLTSIAIPDSVTSIGEGAFNGCSALESITIPDSVTSIADWAFSDCSALESITIPDGVTSIEVGAFEGCTSLTSITIPDGVTNIGEYAFWKCNSLTSITIPDSVASIGDYAFSSCTSLTSITIPDSVTSIGSGAFQFCSNLKDVYYYGTENEWKKISIWLYNEPLTKATMHYNCRPNETLDEEIVRKTKLYTSDGGAVYRKVLESLNENLSRDDISREDKIAMLNNFYKLFNITDIQEGTAYCLEAMNGKRAYDYLTNDEIFLSYQFKDYLHNTEKGTIARGLMIADGWIFNDELKQWVSPETYITKETVAIKNYKSMLLDFMNYKADDGAADDVIDVLNYSNAIKKILSKSLTVADTEAGRAFAKKMDKCTTVEQINELIKDSDLIPDKDYVWHLDGFKELNDAFKQSGNVFKASTKGIDDFLALVHVEAKCETITKYKKFLELVADGEDYLPYSLVVAAQQLLDESINPYISEIKQFLLDYIDCTNDITEFSDSLKKSIKTDLTSKYPHIFTKDVTEFASTFGDALATIELSAFIVDIATNIGTVTNDAHRSEAYAYLGQYFSMILRNKKDQFNTDQSAENAWEFYDIYNLLFRIRACGENSYLKMCDDSPVTWILSSVGFNYFDIKDRKKYVEGTFDYMNNYCFFGLENADQIPESHKFAQKAVIKCPVNVEIYDLSGNLVYTIFDGKEIDETNEIGRFISTYDPKLGEYIKIVYLENRDNYTVKNVGVDSGNVSIETAVVNDDDIVTTAKVSGLPIEEYGIITVDMQTNQYTDDQNGDGNVEYTGVLQNTETSEVVNVTGIELSANTLKLNAGEKTALGVMISPDNATFTDVIWSSDNEDVAMVNNGAVTAISAGTATITAMTSNGITATCIVTVVDSTSEVMGDVTGDGNADIADALFVARADAGLATLSDDQKKAADVNGDGSADIADALFIARVDAGLAKL